MNGIYNCFSYTEDDLSKIPIRPEHSNKGTFGRLLVIGGSIGMSGAAYFSARAAYKSGVGLVEIFTPEENRIILQTIIPEAILTVYNEQTFSARALYSALDRADSVVIGVGLGQSETAFKILSIVLQTSVSHLIIDADALNMIARNKQMLNYIREKRDRSVIITPHPGEMSRLNGHPISFISDDLIGSASEYSEKNNLICVLKSNRTVVSIPSCTDIYINKSGNSGMATAGSGDVLTGIIGALVAQKIPSDEAARLGVYIHGLAGDYAATELGKYSVMASDIINSIPIVFKNAERIIERLSN